MRPSVFAAAAVLALAAAAVSGGPASAQSEDPDNTYVYGSVGYIGHNEHGELGTVFGRGGARWNAIGVEGEVGAGVNRRSTRLVSFRHPTDSWSDHSRTFRTTIQTQTRPYWLFL